MKRMHPDDRDGAPPASSPRLVVIAASAGALPAIIDVLAPLPPEFPAAIALVQHRGNSDPEQLIALLAKRTRLRVCHAADGALLEAGTVYVCPPGVHMTTEHCVRLIDGPKLHFVRPNADLMFDSVSKTYGDRAIGVVLSGCGSDATLGSLAIARAGGTVIAQDDQTSDTGEGIGPELLPHVFEPFCQADLGSSRRQGGLGLGLAIVQQLVELHGGTIDVASPGRGHGATFTVRLPLAPSGST